MVKFGRRLDSEARDGWTGKYIDYRALKRLVYEAKADADREAAFLEAVRSEIGKANAFYAETEKGLRERLDAVEVDIRRDAADATAIRKAKKALLRDIYP